TGGSGTQAPVEPPAPVGPFASTPPASTRVVPPPIPVGAAPPIPGPPAAWPPVPGPASEWGDALVRLPPEHAATSRRSAPRMPSRLAVIGPRHLLSGEARNCNVRVVATRRLPQTVMMNPDGGRP